MVYYLSLVKTLLFNFISRDININNKKYHVVMLYHIIIYYDNDKFKILYK